MHDLSTSPRTQGDRAALKLVLNVLGAGDTQSSNHTSRYDTRLQAGVA